MIIRNYLPSDFPQIEKLWKETGIYTLERGDTAVIIEQCNNMGGQFLVLVTPEKSQVIGTSWMTFDGRRIHLHHFAILPSFQGMGLGRKLALKSLDFVMEKKFPVKLEVHCRNMNAINLYKSLGFEVFKDYDVYMRLDPDPGRRFSLEQ